VEQFIRKFEDVATIAEWPAPVRVFQLPACLTGWARSFAHAGNPKSFWSDSPRNHSQVANLLRRDRRTPLEDYANAIERLAQTALSQAKEDEKRRLVYNAFFRTINNSGLQRYWLAAKVSSIEMALKMGKAHFQVDEPHGADFAAHQVAEEEEKTTTLSTLQVAAATKSLEQTQFTMLMNMMKALWATVTELQRDQTDRQAPLPQDESVRPSQLTCWECGASGHVRRHCLKRGRLFLNHRGSR